MKIIVGIDEVGRGPLAGPVTVCVVSCEEKIYKKLKLNKNLPKAGMDSKKLSANDRQKYAECLKTLMSKTVFDIPQGDTLGMFSYKIVHVSNKAIDSKGISFCIKRAMSQGLEKLKCDPRNCTVLLDGGLKAPEVFKNQKTIIKGDEKEKIIAWASILAKVSRDKLMVKLGQACPEYGFEVHKGYGTVSHREMISMHKLSKYHRKTFCKNLIF